MLKNGGLAESAMDLGEADTVELKGELQMRSRNLRQNPNAIITGLQPEG